MWFFIMTSDKPEAWSQRLYDIETFPWQTLTHGEQ